MDEEVLDQPASLKEETRLARGRTVEFLASVVVLSALLAFAVNLGSSLLLQRLGQQQAIVVMLATLGLSILVIFALLPRISTTVKESHAMVEVCFPLLTSPQDVEVIRIQYYGNVTDVTHAAMARQPSSVRQQMAQLLHRGIDETMAAKHGAITDIMLELAQFLYCAEFARASRWLLGPEAVYHKNSEVALMRSPIDAYKWEDIIRKTPHNRFMSNHAFGVPDKILLPRGLNFSVPDVSQQLSRYTGVKPHATKKAGSVPQYITLLQVKAGNDTALTVSALASYAEFGLPTATSPLRGLTARCILRNARELRIRSLAQKEEALAAVLGEQSVTSRQSDSSAGSNEFSTVNQKLYSEGQRPRLLRIFVHLSGSLHVRLLGYRTRQSTYYIWSTAMSRMLASTDIDSFMATIKDLGQMTPRHMN